LAHLFKEDYFKDAHCDKGFSSSTKNATVVKTLGCDFDHNHTKDNDDIHFFLPNFSKILELSDGDINKDE
jgi:hypothetical protein